MYNKRNFGTMPQTFGGLLEGFLENGLPHVKTDFWYTSGTPVNIQETDSAYELHVVAPGLSKEDFKISLDKNILSIAYDKKEESQEPAAEKAAKWLKNEYHFRSFKRSFTLNEKVDTAGINAKYNDGILYVTLPKKEVSETTTQTINVA